MSMIIGIEIGLFIGVIVCVILVCMALPRWPG
jgi:hypothetical protein